MFAPASPRANSIADLAAGYQQGGRLKPALNQATALPTGPGTVPLIAAGSNPGVVLQTVTLWSQGAGHSRLRIGGQIIFATFNGQAASIAAPLEVPLGVAIEAEFIGTISVQNSGVGITWVLL